MCNYGLLQVHGFVGVLYWKPASFIFPFFHDLFQVSSSMSFDSLPDAGATHKQPIENTCRLVFD